MTEAALVNRVWNDAHVLRRQGIPGEKGDITLSPERIPQTVRRKTRDHFLPKASPGRQITEFSPNHEPIFRKTRATGSTSPAIFAANH